MPGRESSAIMPLVARSSGGIGRDGRALCGWRRACAAALPNGKPPTA